MSLYQKYGFAAGQILSEDQALPNATTGDSTNTAKLNLTGSDKLNVVVTAGSNTVELTSSATLEIMPVVGTAADSLTTTLPSILIKEGVQSKASWAPGEMIAQFVIPAALIGSNRYMKLTYKTSANESADTVDAFLTVI